MPSLARRMRAEFTRHVRTGRNRPRRRHGRRAHARLRQHRRGARLRPRRDTRRRVERSPERRAYQPRGDDRLLVGRSLSRSATCCPTSPPNAPARCSRRCSRMAPRTGRRLRRDPPNFHSPNRSSSRWAIHGILGVRDHGSRHGQSHAAPAVAPFAIGATVFAGALVTGRSRAEASTRHAPSGQRLHQECGRRTGCTGRANRRNGRGDAALRRAPICVGRGG